MAYAVRRTSARNTHRVEQSRWKQFVAISMLCEVAFVFLNPFNTQPLSAVKKEQYQAHTAGVHHVHPNGDVSHFHRTEQRKHPFTIEIFAAPKTLEGPKGEASLVAIHSWLKLSLRPIVTLLGDEPGYQHAANKYGLRINHKVDKNFLGAPLFNSMFHIANQSNATVAVMVNGDIVLHSAFTNALRKVLRRFRHFLVVGAGYGIDSLPRSVRGRPFSHEKHLKQYVLQNGILRSKEGLDFWAWNTNGPPLFDPLMPHFVFGAGKYDNWLLHNTIEAGRREVIDATEVSAVARIQGSQDEHDEASLDESNDGNTHSLRVWPWESRSLLWPDLNASKYETFINTHLSLRVGACRTQTGTILFAPWRLASCLEPGGSCLVKRLRPGVCNCEYSTCSKTTQTDPVAINASRVVTCGDIDHVTKDQYTIPNSTSDDDEKSQAFGFPLSLASLAETVVLDNKIVVTASNYGYRDLMMGWVCNLRHLNLTNFLVAAFDRDLYEFALVRGVPVFFEHTLVQGQGRNISHALEYGLPSFKVLTKLKSRVVLSLLRLGYDTIWSDSDVLWFKNPLHDMQNYEADLVIQTNAADGEPMNSKRRINSGLYMAFSNTATIRAFESIVRFASHSRMSEQPCFYDILCGKDGEYTVGDDKCFYNGVLVHLLDRMKYPNGITAAIWDSPPGEILHRFPHMITIHNNWIKGSSAKLQRFKRHGLLLYDTQTELCVFPGLF